MAKQSSKNEDSFDTFLRRVNEIQGMNARAGWQGLTGQNLNVHPNNDVNEAFRNTYNRSRADREKAKSSVSGMPDLSYGPSDTTYSTADPHAHKWYDFLIMAFLWLLFILWILFALSSFYWLSLLEKLLR